MSKDAIKTNNGENGHRVTGDDRGRTLSESEFRSMSRRSLLTGGGLALAGVFGWRTLQGRPEAGNIPDVLRRGHEFNESLWRGLFRESATAPTFAYEESSELRVNGRHGIPGSSSQVPDRPLAEGDLWEIQVIGTNGEQIGSYGVDDMRALPQTEMTIEHFCVEGWSHIVTWGGVVFNEFVQRFHPDQADAPFVGLYTPDNEYRVGLDMPSMMHAQTMLTMDLQREPLSRDHGGWLRLTTPLKYGTKQIKRIGTIEFSNTQPTDDFWTVRGYDWYSGL